MWQYNQRLAMQCCVNTTNLLPPKSWGSEATPSATHLLKTRKCKVKELLSVRSFWYVLILACALFSMYSFWHVFLLGCAPLACVLFGMCSFWHVLILACAHFDMCSFWHMLILACAHFGMCFLWHVLFWACALFGTLMLIFDSGPYFWL